MITHLCIDNVAIECHATASVDTLVNNGLECANGNFVARWNGCIDQGSVRIRCPKKQCPCNDIGGNGEFRCRKDCTKYGGLRNCLTKGNFITKYNNYKRNHHYKKNHKNNYQFIYLYEMIELLALHDS